MMPGWVAPGVQCICEDDDWKDVFDTGTTGVFPRKGEKFTVSTATEFGGACFLVLAETHVSPDLYAARAFRPLTPLERDVALFDSVFKGAAASAAREPVLAS